MTRCNIQKCQDNRLLHNKKNLNTRIAKTSYHFVTIMSLVAAIRDYIDVINSTYDTLPLDGKLQTLLVPTVTYILGSLKYATLYVASFQWLRDFTYLPLIVPKLTLSVVREVWYPFENPALNFFTFLETPACKNNSFIVGLLNSFFACLPISAGHILSGRRLLVQGIPAGLAAGSGMILGQWWFVACVVMGIRPLLVPWLALEPFNYLLGLGLLVNIVYRITHERRIRVVRWSDKRELLQYFLTSLLLSWCEQTSLFQYLGNVTLNTGTTLLDTFSTSSLGSNALSMEIGYVGGLLVGSCLFSVLFALLALALRGVWLRWRAVTSSRLTNQLNTFFLVSLVGLSFASVPYYGMDYLLSNRIGFLSQDIALDKTVFTPATMDDTTGKMGIMSDKKSFDTDVSTFDRGLYLQQHKPVPQSFEDLNYQGEYAWTKRYGKYVRHLVKRKAPSVWSTLLKRIGENDNLRFTNANDQDRKQKRTQGKIGVISNGIDEQSGDRSPHLQLLENDAVKGLHSSFLEETGQWLPSADMDNDLESEGHLQENTSDIAERLNEDNETENQFLSMFETGLSPLFINYVPEASAFEQRLKKRFAENPLYSLLLRIDIDSFLNRQPKSHSLSAVEEETLFQKRNILGQYYDTLREYNLLQNWDHFQTLYHGSKSFSNRVYNQQFKGTLRVVRRLFSMTPRSQPESSSEQKVRGRDDPSSSSTHNLNGGRVLKYDQPLFYQPKEMSQNWGESLKRGRTPNSSEGLFQEQNPQENGNEDPIFNLHEELTPYKEFVQDISPFVEATQSRPLYAGWDEDLRKLVITNRSLGRSEALYTQCKTSTLTRKGEMRNRGAKSLDVSSDPTLSVDQVTKEVHFTSWPLHQLIDAPSALLDGEKSVKLLSGKDGEDSVFLETDPEERDRLQEVPHQFGFTSAADPKNRKMSEAFDSFAKMQDQGSVGGNSWEMSCWPPNLRLLDDKPEPMAYRHGGFVWPGHSALRFHLDRASK